MRRRYITKPEFQTSFSLCFVRGILIALLLPAAVSFMTLYLLSQDPAVTPLQKASLIAGLNRLGVVFLRFAAGATGCFILIGAYLSHKFAGPLHRLESWSKQYLFEQDPGPLRLRSGDELTSVAQVLNRVITKNF